MSSAMQPGTRTLELRRNTSKQGFDVLRCSDTPPTYRSLVGGCFRTSAGKVARSSEKPPHFLPAQLVSLCQNRTSQNSSLTKPR
jgi:hypothetical protein